MKSLKYLIALLILCSGNIYGQIKQAAITSSSQFSHGSQFVIKKTNVRVIYTKSINNDVASNKPTPSVFPNPFTDNLNISFDSNNYNELIINVRDLVGNLHKEFMIKKSYDNFKQNINLDYLPAGIYLMEMYGVDNYSNISILSNVKIVKVYN